MIGNEDRLKIQAWIDGELASQESSRIADLVDSDMQAKELAEELKTIQTILKTGEKELKIEDSEEFYWNQVQQKIEILSPDIREKNEELAAKGPAPALQWLIPVGSLTAITALILHFNDSEIGQGSSSGVDTGIKAKPANFESKSGLSENGGLGLMEDEVKTGSELGVFSFEGTKNDGDFVNPEDPNNLPESIENPER